MKLNTHKRWFYPVLFIKKGKTLVVNASFQGYDQSY